jgi:hypothetical protein
MKIQIRWNDAELPSDHAYCILQGGRSTAVLEFMAL